MALVRYLIDKSAFARLGHPAVRGLWRPVLESGLVAICPVLEYEVLYSARGPEEYEQLRERLREQWPWLPLADEAHARALQVQRALAAKGQHRCASLPDLVTAATAEAHGVEVLHYDRDYDTIAGVTGQPVRWLAPAGTI
jgi:predicted nucleic acid-binding protein